MRYPSVFLSVAVLTCTEPCPAIRMNHNNYVFRNQPRHLRLAELFPAAFTDTPLDLPATYVPRFTRLTWPARRMMIEAGPTSKVTMTADYDVVSAPKTLVIFEVAISPQVPKEYAWRVILAELLFRYRRVIAIEVHLSEFRATIDGAICAELLNRGEDQARAADHLPVAKAFARLGFRTDKTEIAEVSAERPTLRLVFTR